MFGFFSGLDHQTSPRPSSFGFSNLHFFSFLRSKPSGNNRSNFHRKNSGLIATFTLLLLIASFTTPAHAETFQATADTSFHLFGANQQADQGTSINASKWTTIYVKFDLSSVTTPVSSATFRIFSIAAGGSQQATNPQADVYSVGANNWSEAASNPPPFDQVLDSQVVNEPGFYDFDVTPYVNDNNGGEISFAVRTNKDFWRPFSSREGGNPPELVVDGAASGTPVANFTATPASGQAPLNVNYDASDSTDPDGSIASYNWDFGDGSSDTGASGSHIYTTPGLYTITLTVEDDEGNTDTATTDIRVTSDSETPGLLGTYFDNADLTNEVLTRIDPNIDFDFGAGSPDPLIGEDDFSIRWTGEIEPEFTETYTFYTLSDDGARLLINGELVIDQFVPQAVTEASGSIALEAGQRYQLVMEYFDGPLIGEVHLSWSSASTPKQIVPTSRLFAPVTEPENQPPTVTLAADQIAGNVPLEVSFTASAEDADGAVVRYDWDFGDGSTEENSTAAIIHSYASVGTFTATVTVTDDGDPAATASDTISITVNDDGATSASFTIDADPPIAGEPEVINASTSAAPAGSVITDYAWQIVCPSGSGSVIAFNGNGTDPESESQDVDGVSVTISGNAKTFTMQVEPTGTRCDIELTVGDDAGRQAVFSRDGVAFGAANQAPSITSAATASVVENTTDVTTVTVTDPDAGDTFTFSLTGGADEALFSIDESTATLVFNTAPDFDNPTDDGADNVYDVIVSVTDAGGATDSQPVQVTVTDAANEAPAITSSNTASVVENTADVITVTATDPDAGDTPVFSLTGGADQALFVIDAASGALAFNLAPDFDNPLDNGADNVYDVIVNATDTSGATDSQAVQVTVTNAANEAPAITSSDTVSVVENTTAVTAVTATDPDAGDSLTFSLSGGADQGQFSLDTATGQLDFIAAPDFDNPTDDDANNVYDVSVTVTDAAGESDTQLVQITVTNAANEAPSITSSDAANVVENTTDVTTVTAIDPDAGDSLTFSLTGGVDQALFAIDTTSGVLVFATAPDFDNPADDGANNVYDVIVSVTDAGGATASQPVQVTVTDAANEAPAITSSNSASVVENTANVITVTATDPDAGDTPVFSLTGGADQALFVIDAASGALAFNLAPDFDNPLDNGADNVYDVIVNATDTSGATDSQAVQITVTNAANEAPTITSAATASVAENTTDVITVTATDLDAGDSLAFSVTGGADQAEFAIDAATGALTFATAPDFDIPGDANTDNDYEVEITVTDAAGLTDVQTFVATVTNVANEAPSITSAATTSVFENTTDVITVTATDPDTTDTLTFSITGGTDEGAFSIDPATGALTFNSAPDFDAPGDANTDNDYAVEITVTDAAGLTDVQTFIATVTNVANEAPSITSAATASIAENTTEVITVTAADPDSGDTQTYSVTGGADAAQFSIVAASGELVFASAPDFDVPGDANNDNDYEVEITVTDGSGATDAQSLVVTVTNVFETLLQEATFDCDTTIIPGGLFTCRVNYSTNDSNPATTGLGLKLHFDSSVLTWQSFDNVLQTDLLTEATQAENDSADLDGVAATDQYINVSWAVLGSVFDWPGGTLPTQLYEVTFKVNETASPGDTTSLNFSAQPAAGLDYGFTTDSQDITVGDPSGLAILDVDGNGSATTTTDGILIMRYLFGFRGDELVNGAVGSGATRDAAAIEQIIEVNLGQLDIDDDGATQPLTDGLLILRFLTGLTGDDLTAGAVNQNGNRTDNSAIETYLAGLSS